MMKLKTREDSILGSGDGLSSTLGLIIAMAIANSPALASAAVAATIGSSLSMSLNEWNADTNRSAYRASMMGISTFFGAISPALPFFILSGTIAYILCGIICICACTVITKMRVESGIKALLLTFGVTLTAGTCAVVGSFIFTGTA